MIPYFKKIPLIAKIIAVMVPFRYQELIVGVRKCTRVILYHTLVLGEKIAMCVAPRVGGFIYHAYSGKSIYEKKNRENIMAEKMKCEYCEKDAIGYQGFGCCAAYVCHDHADTFVLHLNPGEKLISGECYFERFRLPE